MRRTCELVLGDQLQQVCVILGAARKAIKALHTVGMPCCKFREQSVETNQAGKEVEGIQDNTIRKKALHM